jgi:hypothetical protein
MKGSQASEGTAVLIEALQADAQRLSAEQFAAKHGTGFLLVTAAGVDENMATSTTKLWLEGIDDDPAAHTADLAIVVYPLRPRSESQTDLVAMGRDARNDVVIPDVSVSRFHAMAKRNDSGAFLMLDAGSTNGTTVNGSSVPPRGAGPPTRLKPGDTVKIGQVEFTFTDAASLQEFVRKAAG